MAQQKILPAKSLGEAQTWIGQNISAFFVMETLPDFVLFACSPFNAEAFGIIKGLFPPENYEQMDCDPNLNGVSHKGILVRITYAAFDAKIVSLAQESPDRVVYYNKPARLADRSRFHQPKY